MENLKELIGEEVFAEIEDLSLKCEVIDVTIEDYYFQEKGEAIFISVNVKPIDDLPEGVDIEEMTNIPLDNIRKA